MANKYCITCGKRETEAKSQESQESWTAPRLNQQNRTLHIYLQSSLPRKSIRYGAWVHSMSNGGLMWHERVPP